MRTEYYTLGEDSICEACRTSLLEAAEPVRDWGLVGRACAFGLGGALVGAALYYGVIALTGYEIGLVAIAIGYIVGRAVRKGARDRGGRRLQVAAVALTYLSLSLAYLSVVVDSSLSELPEETSVEAESDADFPDGLPAAGIEMTVGGAGAAQVSPEGEPAPDDLLEVSAEAPSPDPAADEDQAGFTTYLVGIPLLIGFALTLPVLLVVGSMPSGLISALIMGVGLLQAWSSTAAPELTVMGPFRLNPQPDERTMEAPQE